MATIEFGGHDENKRAAIVEAAVMDIIATALEISP